MLKISKMSVAFLGVFIIWAILGILFAGDLKTHRPCYTIPAGDTRGGADCAARGCYSVSGSSDFVRHVGTGYTKCGTTEYAYNYKEGDMTSLGNGGPLCATVFLHVTHAGCLAGQGGSISQRFYSSYPPCTPAS